MLDDFIGKPISLQVESTFHQEQYDIILMWCIGVSAQCLTPQTFTPHLPPSAIVLSSTPPECAKSFKQGVDMTHAIEVRGLSKSFRADRKALDDVTLHVAPCSRFC